MNTSQTLPIIDRATFDTYRYAAREVIASLKHTYPELSPDSLSAMLYIAALELQATEGYAATTGPEFQDTVCEQIVGLSEPYQADAALLAGLPASAMMH
jgi:hypothetical protein